MEQSILCAFPWTFVCFIDGNQGKLWCDRLVMFCDARTVVWKWTPIKLVILLQSTDIELFRALHPFLFEGRGGKSSYGDSKRTLLTQAKEIDTPHHMILSRFWPVTERLETMSLSCSLKHQQHSAQGACTLVSNTFSICQNRLRSLRERESKISSGVKILVPNFL